MGYLGVLWQGHTPGRTFLPMHQSEGRAALTPQYSPTTPDMAPGPALLRPSFRQHPSGMPLSTSLSGLAGSVQWLVDVGEVVWRLLEVVDGIWGRSDETGCESRLPSWHPFYLDRIRLLLSTCHLSDVQGVFYVNIFLLSHAGRLMP